MSKIIYKWLWTLEDGSERKIEISTAFGKDVARQRALTYFPDDQIAITYITTTEPEETQDVS